MTLLEILVKELPRRGGWPSENICVLVQSHTGHIYRDGGVSLFCCDRASDWELSEVTREQYEAALVASDAGRAGSGIGLASEWNGEGLPPVGVECERKWKGHPDAYWSKIKVLWINHEKMLIEYSGGGHYKSHVQLTDLQNVEFRPIRSEADRKRDEACRAISHILDEDRDFQFFSKNIYDAISAGKIPGIRIE